MSASVDSLNWDLISVSSSSNGIPNNFTIAPAIAMFMFRPWSLNCSAVMIVPLFFRNCSWVFRVCSSRAARMSIVASWLSICSSETERVLKLWPPRIRDA